MAKLYYNRQGILIKEKESKMSKKYTESAQEMIDEFNEVTSFELAKENVRGLLSYMGEDNNREGLLDTPRRVVEMYNELTSGYAMDPIAIIEKAVFHEETKEMVIVKNIPFYSLCEHHLAPFFGTATIGYLPNDGRIVGLSKLARVLDAYARRLQVQERLGAQVANAFYQSSLQPEGVGVHIEAEHLCMAMRGVQKPGTSTTTVSIRGIFESDKAVKDEWTRLALS
jgi:GTP cyclohydrolase I